ncbi:hypothetical protein JDV02_006527 [Purpureocillium takamizusanense]|uniref:Allergen Asp f 4 n=1 Tax=Purpureocillium takamizusanense TaxID=2060973 RepID=A0A9Q8QIQ9_9HYPO|nr:uncharacterized protein JDV02_006527 [Purpureocillium takamizusanense]UNI20440.1 hypothetical protein JDV02_006527 [Purpureocillium takamizusanense]
MKVSTTAIFLATALGVAAHPSGAAHQHQHLHKRLDFVKAGKPAPAPVKAEVQPTIVAPPPAATSTQAAQSSAGGSGGSGAGVKQYTPFCGGGKRATVEQIAYKGNVGGTGSQYGCNMMLVSLDIMDKYDYRNTFVETQGKDQKCACWNKIGPEGLINGFFANANPNALKFDLPANSKQGVVFDKNSQGACACGVGELTSTKNGMFGGTWFEFDFGNESNNEWSGGDASCLTAFDEKSPITAMTVSGGPCDGSSHTESIVNSDGTGSNAFLGGMNKMDGIGFNIPRTSGPICFKIKV